MERKVPKSRCSKEQKTATKNSSKCQIEEFWPYFLTDRLVAQLLQETFSQSFQLRNSNLPLSFSPTLSVIWTQYLQLGQTKNIHSSVLFWFSTRKVTQLCLCSHLISGYKYSKEYWKKIKSLGTTKPSTTPSQVQVLLSPNASLKL